MTLDEVTTLGSGVDGHVLRQRTTYASLGNWSNFVTDSNGGAPGGTITTRTKTHNRRNRILSITGQTTPLYDNNGNMTRDEMARSFKYDAWDRLVAEGVGVENVRYTVDGRGYRVQRIAGGQTTLLFYSDDWQLLEEKIEFGATQATYVWGEGYPDALIARDHVTHGRQYAQQDANYNVTSLTNNGGTVQERYVYDPYGTVTYKTGTWGVRASSSYAWVYLHQGGRFDSITGLYHFRYRDYSATLGRWVSTDPLEYADGMNLYLVYGSGPVTYSDPIGLYHGPINDGQPTGAPAPPGEGNSWVPHGDPNDRNGVWRPKNHPSPTVDKTKWECHWDKSGHFDVTGRDEDGKKIHDRMTPDGNAVDPKWPHKPTDQPYKPSYEPGKPLPPPKPKPPGGPDSGPGKPPGGSGPGKPRTPKVPGPVKRACKVIPFFTIPWDWQEARGNGHGYIVSGGYVVIEQINPYPVTLLDLENFEKNAPPWDGGYYGDYFRYNPQQ